MNDDLFLIPPELARRWRVSSQTLANWRAGGAGPSFIKLGRRVLYRLAEIEAIEAGATNSRPMTATSGNYPGNSAS